MRVDSKKKEYSPISQETSKYEDNCECESEIELPLDKLSNGYHIGDIFGKWPDEEN